MMEFSSRQFQSDPGDEDVYGMMVFADPQDASIQKRVQILLKDHGEKGVIEPVTITEHSEFDLYLVIHRQMASEIHAMGYGPLLHRALTLTAMEFITTD